MDFDTNTKINAKATIHDQELKMLRKMHELTYLQYYIKMECFRTGNPSRQKHLQQKALSICLSPQPAK